jgi:hypothetical protein
MTNRKSVYDEIVKRPIARNRAAQEGDVQANFCHQLVGAQAAKCVGAQGACLLSREERTYGRGYARAEFDPVQTSGSMDSSMVRRKIVAEN